MRPSCLVPVKLFTFGSKTEAATSSVFWLQGRVLGYLGSNSSKRAAAVHMCPQTGFPVCTLFEISEICCLALWLQILAFPNYKDFIQNM